MVEQRKGTRVPAVLAVQLGAVTTTTENISEGGLFVRTEAPLSVGAPLTLSISFPSAMDPIEVLGLVAWRRVAQSGEPAGVGVSLSHDGQRRLPQLRALLASSLAASDRLPNREAGYRILITDDSPNTSSLYRYAMRKLAIAEWGKPQPGSAPSPLTVDHASDGDQAFRLVQERSYALVITDLYMPVLDGFALIDRMRAAPALSATRILVISAGDDALLERAKEMGADAVLQKPAKVADVVSAARALLRLQRGA